MRVGWTVIREDLVRESSKIYVGNEKKRLEVGDKVKVRHTRGIPYACPVRSRVGLIFFISPTSTYPSSPLLLLHLPLFPLLSSFPPPHQWLPPLVDFLFVQSAGRFVSPAVDSQSTLLSTNATLGLGTIVEIFVESTTHSLTVRRIPSFVLQAVSDCQLKANPAVKTGSFSHPKHPRLLRH